MLPRLPCSTLTVPHDATGLGSQFTHSATRVPCCVLSLGTYNFNDENPQLWGSRVRNSVPPYLSLQSAPEKWHGVIPKETVTGTSIECILPLGRQL